MIEKNTSWGPIADWYDGLVEDTSDSYQKNVLMPNLIRLIVPKAGMTILDVACGQGYFSRAFANNGAEVIGSDVSIELIELANKHIIGKGRGIGSLNYHVSESHKLSFVADLTVDIVVIVLALQNIDKMMETIQECSRTLKVGGKLILVLNHPAFRIPKNSSWRWASSIAAPAGENVLTTCEATKGGTLSQRGIGDEKMYRRIDSYMSDAQIKVDMTPGEKSADKKKFTVSFHRPLQSYFKALTKGGLVITRFEEWISHKKSQIGPRSTEEDRMRKEIPMFLMIESKKV